MRTDERHVSYWMDWMGFSKTLSKSAFFSRNLPPPFCLPAWALGSESDRRRRSAASMPAAPAAAAPEEESSLTPPESRSESPAMEADTSGALPECRRARCCC